MPYNLISNQFGLFGFLRKYGEAIQILIEEINGFLTTTEGIYNPVNYPDRWKNVPNKPYSEEPFTLTELTPLVVTTNKQVNKKIKLNIGKPFTGLQTKDRFNIFKECSGYNVSNLTISKPMMSLKKIQKLKILIENRGIYAHNISIHKEISNRIPSPINIKTWVKRYFSNKLGVKSWVKTRYSERISEKPYIIDDVGTISDIELLEIIKEIETIDAI